MASQRRFRSVIIGAVLGLSLANPAYPCAFHGYTPDPTMVDLLLATEQVITARISTSGTPRYVPHRTLAGPSVSDIPIAVSRNFRRGVASDPQATVLLARDGAYGPWTEIAVLDSRFAEIVQVVMQRQSDWQLGGDDDRLRLFVPRVNDPNPDIRRLALRELDRAPYATLRELRLPLVQNLRSDLENGEQDLRPIRILLAGLSNDPGFAPYLREALGKAVNQNVPHLGAYATALIELDGQRGVQTIIETHLAPNTLSWEAREKLLEALAIQYRAAPQSVRRLITREVARLSRQSPDLREAAARQFGSQSRWRPGGQPAGEGISR